MATPQLGLIPAHAGKTFARCDSSPPTRAHPRSRGENTTAWVATNLNSGSSPLTRGKRRSGGGPGAQRGLIPAHAGKTRLSAWHPSRHWAHPRSRGENGGVGREGDKRHGSSPLTRGKPLRVRTTGNGQGLIPAHAGKTWAVSGPTGQRWAHPRSRGENRQGATVGRGAQGSSPLTRGKLARALHLEADRGLIPAHAGKTDAGAGCASAFGAHPRSRGENTERTKTMALNNGSSPLTRGKLASRLETHGASRLIPAHAGKTVLTSATVVPAWAHPRSRGENAGSGGSLRS